MGFKNIQMTKHIAAISDCNLIGSGYLNIIVPICEGLTKKGHEVKVIGLQYKGDEHPYDFSIIPAGNLQEVLAILQNMFNMWTFEYLIVTLDIPVQEAFLREIKKIGINNAEYIEIGVDTDLWRVPTKDERNNLRRALGFEEDEFVVLTVADNQERKHLSRSMEMFTDFLYEAKDVDIHKIRTENLVPKKKAKYVLGKGKHLAFGWRIDD